MRHNRLWLLSFSVFLVLVLLLACSPASTPTPAATKSSPTAASSPAPSAAPSLTAKPSPSTTAAASGAVSFAGKTISIIVPFAPGGGTDISARFYRQFLAKHLPGQPTVIVRNVPGGEAITGTNMAYRARPDGLTVFISSGSVYMAQLLRKPALEVNILDGTATLGNVNAYIYYTTPKMLDKPEDIMNAKGLVYGTTPGANGTVFLLAREFIGFPIEKAIIGYAATGETRRAQMAGEITATNETLMAYQDFLEPRIKASEARVIFQSGQLDLSGKIVRSPLWPDYLTAEELYQKVKGSAPTGTAYDTYKALVQSTAAMTNILTLLPGTPANIKQIYWATAQTMVKDPEFLKMAERVAGGTTWFAGESFDKLWHNKFGMDAQLLKWLSDLLSSKYGMVLA